MTYDDKHAEQNARARVQRGGVTIIGKKIPVGGLNVGIGTWGAIDFLVRKFGYRVVRT